MILKKSISLIVLLTINMAINAQRVYPIAPGILIDSIYKVKSGATKLSMDAISGRLFYSSLNGDIYEVITTSYNDTVGRRQVDYT